MFKIEREELKQNWQFLIDFIQAHHVMEKAVETELYHNHTPVEGLCHTRGYFIIVKGYYIQYVIDHIIFNVELMLIARRVDHVIIYENYIEYEAARQKAMGSTKDQTGINLN